MAKTTEFDSSAVNILNAGTVIRGDIESSGSLRVDGKIIGTINAKEKVAIGQTGYVEGEINCKSAEVSGKIKGKLVVQELLSMKSSAQLDGDVFTKKLAIEPGAVFNASCKMTDNPAAMTDRPKLQDDKKQPQREKQNQPA